MNKILLLFEGKLTCNSVATAVDAIDRYAVKLHLFCLLFSMASDF